jgi:DNA-directed RNA polymerase alpha subunit
MLRVLAETAEEGPMKRPTMTLALTMMILAAPAYAQSVTMKEEKPGLLQKAKITVDAATSIAQAKVPKGKIVSAEIEEEEGKLIFSFDVKTVGKRGIDEVNVDAVNGKVLSVQHETPQDEAKERRADRKKP